jgi:outer membrane protein OmpA-like peptidoglycan-associated protein
MRTVKLFTMSFGLCMALAASALAGPSDHQAEDHQGPFVQAGMLGMIDLDIGDNIRIFDIGPGAFVGLGYNWGLLGLRTNFHYSQMDWRTDRFPNVGLFSDLFGGGLELKISPLGEKDIFLQPYIVAGIGAHYLESSVGNLSAGDWGFAGNGGVGLDIFLVDGFAITLETNIRPSVFYQDPQLGTNNSYDVYFYDFMGGFTYVFGKPSEAVAAPAAEPTPAPKKAAPATMKKIDLKGEINFKTASAEILPSSYPILDDAVAKMKAHPEIKLVEIEGHTDSRGNDAYNMDLSQRRSDSVKNYFVSKGIDGNRLRTKGYGESKPIAPNDTPENLAKNRRIEFSVVEFAQ